MPSEYLPVQHGVKGEIVIGAAPSSGPDTAARFIAANLPLAGAPGIAEIRIHTAGPSSGLRRLVQGRIPYWAWCWAGGLALARHVLAHPEIVEGRRVLDLGAGSGLVGIAAARAGASGVVAAEIDDDAVVAIGLNAAANGVAVSILHADILDAAPPQVDVVLCGDLFYDRHLARRAEAFLDRCTQSGAQVFVGDPGRAFLPLQRLRPVANYPARDFGDSGAGETRASVFSFLRDGG